MGVMLGATLGPHVEGQVREKRPGRPEVTHKFWTDRGKLWRVERSDGLTYIDAKDGSATLNRRRIEEVAPVRHRAGFHLPARLLQPVYAPLWGRPDDDWCWGEATGSAGAANETPNMVEYGLLRNDGSGEQVGLARIDPATGWLWHVETPDFRWSLEAAGTEPAVPQPGRLFVLPKPRREVERKMTAADLEQQARRSAVRVLSAYETIDPIERAISECERIKDALDTLIELLDLDGDEQASQVLALLIKEGDAPVWHRFYVELAEMVGGPAALER